MKINLPTWLTLFRLVLVPFVIVLLFLPYVQTHYVATAAFVVALATDWLDGWLARRWQQESPFGAFLDPVADKMLVCSVVVLLVYADPRIIIAVPAMIIIGREVAVSALREWMSELGERGLVAVGKMGKYKTAIQMLAIVLMLVELDSGGAIYDFGTALLIVAALLTLWSMSRYLQSAWPHLSGQMQENG